MGMHFRTSVVTGMFVFACFLFSLWLVPPGTEEFFYPLMLEIFPLAMACLLLVFLAAGQLRCLPLLSHVRGVFFILLAAAFTWAGLVAFLYDYPAHTRLRLTSYTIGEVLRPAFDPRPLVLVYKSEPVMRLVDEDALLAFPQVDKCEDIIRLLDFEMQRKGRRAYALLPDDPWKTLLNELLDKAGYDLDIGYQGQDVFLAEIIRRNGNDRVLH